jgi:antitoxin HicB
MAIRAKKNPHDGSTLEDWLHEEGILDEVRAEADRRIKRWQLDEEMKRRGEAGEALPPRKRRTA